MRMYIGQKIHKKRRPTNLSIDEGLVVEARQLGLNISGAAEAGLMQAVKQAKAEQWLSENKQAVKSSNEYVDEFGLPLLRHRNF